MEAITTEKTNLPADWDPIGTLKRRFRGESRPPEQNVIHVKPLVTKTAQEYVEELRNPPHFDGLNEQMLIGVAMEQYALQDFLMRWTTLVRNVPDRAPWVRSGSPDAICYVPLPSGDSRLQVIEHAWLDGRTDAKVEMKRRQGVMYLYHIQDMRVKRMEDADLILAINGEMWTESFTAEQILRHGAFYAEKEAAIIDTFTGVRPNAAQDWDEKGLGITEFVRSLDAVEAPPIGSEEIAPYADRARILKLEIEAKEKEMALLRGEIELAMQTFQIKRVEGTIAIARMQNGRSPDRVDVARARALDPSLVIPGTPYESLYIVENKKRKEAK